MSECLMTGCRLVLPQENRSVWGDLHKVGSAFVFNACLVDGEAAWEYDYNTRDYDLTQRCVTISPHFHYFERRGVIVFDKYHAHYNEQALLYMRGTP